MAASAAACAAPVMGDPKIEIIYNVGGVTQKPDNQQQLADEEEARKKRLEMKAKIEEKRMLVISKYNAEI